MDSQLNRKTKHEPSFHHTARTDSCPRCKWEAEVPSDVCSRCGFSLSVCEALFPFDAPALSLILDPSRILPPSAANDLRRPYKALRKRIPQVDISFCLLQLQPGCSIEEFSFWLFNTAPHADASRAWTLLVTVDFTSSHVNLTCGYALEPFLVHELWEASLQELAACLGDGHWREGMSVFLRDSRKLLSSASLASQGRKCQPPRPQTEAPVIPEGLSDYHSPSLTTSSSQIYTKARPPGEESVSTGHLT